MLIPFNSALLFPPKAATKPVHKAAKLALASNHFPVAFPHQQFRATEWTFTVVLQSALPAYLADPAGQEDAVVALDNRVLIDSVLSEFRREIRQHFGLTFTNGASLYCFKELTRKEVVVSGGRKHAVVFRVTPNRVTLDSLSSDKTRGKVLQVLNSQVKSIFKHLGFLELGFNKRYYDPKLTQNFDFEGSRFTLLKGFSAVFDAYENGLMLQLDYATRVVSDEDLWSKLRQEMDRRGKAPLQAVLEDMVVGKSFMTTYGNQKLIIIDGADLDKTPLSPFPNPKFATFKEYFQRTYNRTIRDDGQFLLFRRSNRRVYDESGVVQTVKEVTFFVPELLKAEGIPDRLRRNLTFMKEISSRTILPPRDRFQKTLEMVNTLNADASKAIEFVLDKNGNRVSGHRFEPPRILCDGPAIQPKEDRLRLNRLAEKRDVVNWALLYDAQSEQFLKPLLANLGKVAGGYKVALKDPRYRLVVSERAKIDDVVAKTLKGADKPDLVVVFGSRRVCGGLYKDLKRRFMEHGVVTQFFASFNPNKDVECSPKYVNLVNQIQAKLGSNLWLVETNLTDTLVLGADVFHSRARKSVAALVGQFGRNLKHTFTSTTLQSGSYEEIIDAMPAMFLEVLEYYLKVEKKLPEKVLFYRDGVGQSFIERTLEAEISGIVAAMAKKYTLRRPKITVVLITKRIGDKLVTADSTPANPPAGTVVDSGVVSPDHFSFLMVAQKVTQGTANPTKYQLVYDENDTRPDELVRLTHDLC